MNRITKLFILIGFIATFNTAAPITIDDLTNTDLPALRGNLERLTQQLGIIKTGLGELTTAIDDITATSPSAGGGSSAASGRGAATGTPQVGDNIFEYLKNQIAPTYSEEDLNTLIKQLYSNKELTMPNRQTMYKLITNANDDPSNTLTAYKKANAEKILSKAKNLRFDSGKLTKLNTFLAEHPLSAGSNETPAPAGGSNPPQSPIQAFSKTDIRNDSLNSGPPAGDSSKLFSFQFHEKNNDETLADYLTREYNFAQQNDDKMTEQISQIFSAPSGTTLANIKMFIKNQSGNRATATDSLNKKNSAILAQLNTKLSEAKTTLDIASLNSLPWASTASNTPAAAQPAPFAPSQAAPDSNIPVIIQPAPKGNTTAADLDAYNQSPKSRNAFYWATWESTEKIPMITFLTKVAEYKTKLSMSDPDILTLLKNTLNALSFDDKNQKPAADLLLQTLNKNNWNIENTYQELEGTRISTSKFKPFEKASPFFGKQTLFDQLLTEPKTAKPNAPTIIQTPLPSKAAPANKPPVSNPNPQTPPVNDLSQYNNMPERVARMRMNGDGIEETLIENYLANRTQTGSSISGIIPGNANLKKADKDTNKKGDPQPTAKDALLAQLQQRMNPQAAHDAALAAAQASLNEANAALERTQTAFNAGFNTLINELLRDSFLRPAGLTQAALNEVTPELLRTKSTVPVNDPVYNKALYVSNKLLAEETALSSEATQSAYTASYSHMSNDSTMVDLNLGSPQDLKKIGEIIRDLIRGSEGNISEKQRILTALLPKVVMRSQALPLALFFLQAGYPDPSFRRWATGALVWYCGQLLSGNSLCFDVLSKPVLYTLINSIQTADQESLKAIRQECDEYTQYNAVKKAADIEFKIFSGKKDPNEKPIFLRRGSSNLSYTDAGTPKNTGMQKPPKYTTEGYTEEGEKCRNYLLKALDLRRNYDITQAQAAVTDAQQALDAIQFSEPDPATPSQEDTAAKAEKDALLQKLTQAEKALEAAGWESAKAAQKAQADIIAIKNTLAAKKYDRIMTPAYIENNAGGVQSLTSIQSATELYAQRNKDIADILSYVVNHNTKIKQRAQGTSSYANLLEYLKTIITNIISNDDALKMIATNLNDAYFTTSLANAMDFLSIDFSTITSASFSFNGNNLMQIYLKLLAQQPVDSTLLQTIKTTTPSGFAFKKNIHQAIINLG